MRTATMNWTVEKLVDYIDKGQVKFDNPVQRPYVWTDDMKSQLLDTAMRGFPMGVIHVDKNTTTKKWLCDVMDGQQRCTTLYKFMKGEFALQNIIPFEFEEKEYDVNGCYFDDLPEELQKEIRSYALNIVYCENATQDEKRELFAKLNNGKALTAKQKVVASVNNFEEVMEMSHHPIFQMLLTQKGFENKNYIQYIMKMWAMLNMNVNDVSFESKVFHPMISKTRMTPEQIEEIKGVLDYAQKVLEYANSQPKSEDAYRRMSAKLKKEVHFISLVPFFKRAKELNMSYSQFYHFAGSVLYWVNKDYAKGYKNASQKDTSKNAQIVTRNDIFELAWEDYFKGKEIEPIANVTVVEVEELAKDTEPKYLTTEEALEILESDSVVA